MEPVIYGSKSVCNEISFVSSVLGEANKRTRKYRGDPQNGEKPCAADQVLRSVLNGLENAVVLLSLLPGLGLIAAQRSNESILSVAY